MALTEKQIQNAKPRAKIYKLYDGNGLLLRVKPNGTKVWEYKYRIHGESKSIEKMLSLGVYGEVSLKEARNRCLEARKLKRDNKDPAEVKKTQKRLAKFNAENTFEGVARDWHNNNLAKWTPRHAGKLMRRLELHIFPALGAKPIADISTLDVLDTIKKLEKDDKTETTHKILQDCKAVFRYAVLTQKIKYNPALDLTGVLKPHITESHPTIGHIQIPAFLAKLEEVKTTPMNRIAVKMLLHTFVRQGELRRAKWVDIDFAAKEWRLPADTTKMRQLHIVPLSNHMLAILNDLKSYSGNSEYLFPSQNRQKNPIMSENTVNQLIHKMGYKGKLVGHGFRAMASTILNENGFGADVIERQLAHMPRDKVRAAYNRAQYLPERRRMMQWWGDYLDGLGQQR